MINEITYPYYYILVIIFQVANVFLLLTLMSNKIIIFGIINIIQKFIEWLKINNEIVKNKMILLKVDLITI